jgi:hypothetical protein
MKVDDGVETPHQESKGGIQFVMDRYDFVKIGIVGEAGGKTRLDQNGDPEVRKLFLQSANRPRQEKAISH